MRPTIAIGDVHGLTFWKNAVEESEGKRIVFLGDYLDPYQYIPDRELLENLEEIIRLKMERPEQVILLLGNHDLHYISELAGRCRRYNLSISDDAGKLFRGHAGCFQIAYQDGDVLFTHAGVSQDWFETDFGGMPDREVANQLNYPNDGQRAALYRAGECRGGERGKIGGPLWLDRREATNPLHGYTQVVGHTRMPHVTDCRYGNANRIFFCDSLFNGNYWDSDRHLSD